MGIDYPLPDLSSPIIPAKMIIHDKQGNATGAGAIKLVGEIFLWLDLSASIRERVVAIRKLSEVSVDQAKRLGLEEISCWVPPQIEKQFAHMLESLGWLRSPWPNWTKILK